MRTTFVDVMDKFRAYLAFLVSDKGSLLARNTVTSYFCNVKLWLMELYPARRNQSTAIMLKLGGVLERYCLKRDSGGMVVKATAAKKDDLNTLIQFLYSTAVNPKDYHDACLLMLLWYCFGRASDLLLLKRRNLSMGPRNVMFLKLIRVKTSEEQGLSIFHENSVFTCPIVALGAWLAMDTTPQASLFGYLPKLSQKDLPLFWTRQDH
ncbi:hypothetical protein AaE_016261 [Aphanomyces astaci]|uniref:Uncharacterized protein n=1 Tax=Aphanomyces astaci TaxID=112090 RepID=A0A6A4YX35_APHAT|nr:hypothetical protein AaE_016261 [Aphanomyces astaci]